MVGSAANRKKLAAALVAAGLENVHTTTQGVEFGPYTAAPGSSYQQQNEICLQNGRKVPTLIEYTVSWYSENLTGKSDEIAKRVVEITTAGHIDELRRLRSLFDSLSEHRRSAIVNKQHTQTLKNEIKLLVDALNSTPVKYKVDDMVSYYQDCR